MIAVIFSAQNIVATLFYFILFYFSESFFEGIDPTSDIGPRRNSIFGVSVERIHAYH